MGKSTISMVIFHSFLYVYQRVIIYNPPDSYSTGKQKQVLWASSYSNPQDSYSMTVNRETHSYYGLFLLTGLWTMDDVSTRKQVQVVLTSSMFAGFCR